MVILKTNWVDGDILTAGTTASTSGVNGICYEINGKMKTVITSNNVTVVVGAAGGTLGIYTIPAGTVRAGVVIMGGGDVDHYANRFDASNFADFNIQTGPLWNVTTKKTLRCYTGTHVPLVYTETGGWTGHSWTTSTTIIKITADVAISGTSATLNSVIMLGY